MPMMYAVCGKCNKTKEVYPGVQLCPQCYQQKEYWKRTVAAAKADPAVAMKQIADGLKALRRLRDSGLLTPFKYASVAEELINVSQQLQNTLMMDQGIQILDMAQEDQIDGVLKRQVAWADSPEEAERLLAERKTFRLIEQSTKPEKPEEQPPSQEDKEGDDPVAA
jgi:hypothetical protein